MSRNIKTKSLAVAVALSFAAAGASASPIDLTYMGTDASPKKIVTVKTTSTTPDVTTRGYAYGFKMREDASDPLTEFLAWCLDIENTLGTGSAYEYKITTSPFSNSYGLDSGQRGRVQDVFDANYGGLDVTNGIHAAGFQVALWDALYGDDSDSDVETGAFQVLTAASDVIDKANEYLGLAASNTDKKFNLTFYESTGNKQNLVSATPVPLPAAGWLMVAGLGGLAAMRRRKKAA